MTTAQILAEPGLVWIAAGLVLLVTEVLAPGMFLVWLGVAAIGTGLISHQVEPSFGREAAIFAALSAAAIALALQLRRSVPRTRLNTPPSGLVGRTATALSFTDTEGRVRLGDSDWAARVPPGDATPAPAARLEVLGLDGTVLIVRERPAASPALSQPASPHSAT